MASTGTATVDVTYVLDGSNFADLQRLADIVNTHESLHLVESNESTMTVTATATYDIAVDAATSEFTATQQQVEG